LLAKIIELDIMVIMSYYTADQLLKAFDKAKETQSYILRVPDPKALDASSYNNAMLAHPDIYKTRLNAALEKNKTELLVAHTTHYHYYVVPQNAVPETHQYIVEEDVTKPEWIVAFEVSKDPRTALKNAVNALLNRTKAITNYGDEGLNPPVIKKPELIKLI
jgi:hypothetical protein